MLFNSYPFIFLFLPLVLLVYGRLSGRGAATAAMGWLVVASLFFYGWWNPPYLALIGASVAVNFGVGRLLARSRSRALLGLGVAANLALLGYYKYAGFLANTANALLGTGLDFGTILLPLAISFFTFQQIAYLVDTHAGRVSPHGFLHYALFVTFFPQLIAGPIVHQSEMLPQFYERAGSPLRHEDLAVGATLFLAGLFKKVVFADGVAAYSTPVFAAADAGASIDFVTAWRGALAYAFQIYFDFSGYSDMAIGLGRLFGVRLPLNFHSPYRATSIIDFWPRWHMTLSRFLRDYLYIPLGGNRRGAVRRYVNLLITMLLGGLWHGAGWNFVIWGGLHGLYLVANHGWRALRPPRIGRRGPWRSLACGAFTFLAVDVAWVFFRAETLPGALRMLAGMCGLAGLSLPTALEPLLGPLAPPLRDLGVRFVGLGGLELAWGAAWISGLALIAFAMPNTQQWMARFQPALSVPREHGARRERGWLWQPTRGWAVVTGLIGLVAFLHLSHVSEFLYFQF